MFVLTPEHRQTDMLTSKSTDKAELNPVTSKLSAKALHKACQAPFNAQR